MQRCCQWMRPHRDIWQTIWAAVDDYGDSQISTTKVKAHKSFESVRNGTIGVRDRTGNALADERTRLGARLHGVGQQTINVSKQIGA